MQKQSRKRQKQTRENVTKHERIICGTNLELTAELDFCYLSGRSASSIVYCIYITQSAIAWPKCHVKGAYIVAIPKKCTTNRNISQRMCNSYAKHSGHTKTKKKPRSFNLNANKLRFVSYPNHLSTREQRKQSNNEIQKVNGLGSFI